MAIFGGVGNPVEVGGGGGAATDLALGSDARGMIARREAATWEGHQAKTATDYVGGDGTDVKSLTMSGDATLNAGAITLASTKRILTTTTNFTSVNILSNTAGTLNHASGVELVAAVAGFRIEVLACVLQFDFVTAAYTGGGNVGLWYAGTSVGQFSNSITAANSFGSGDDIWCYWGPNLGITFQGVGLHTAPTGKAVVMRSSAVFTQPGTAAGTGTVYTTYVVVDE